MTSENQSASPAKAEEDSGPVYRSKIKQVAVNEERPIHKMPDKSKIAEESFSMPSATPWWLATLLLAILCFIGFSLFEAFEAIAANFKDYPLSMSVLTALSSLFVISLLALILSEVRGYRSVTRYFRQGIDLELLNRQGDKAASQQVLAKTAENFSKNSYAALCYRRFAGALNSDLSNSELVDLYRRMVAQAVLKKAEEVLKKESFVSGGLSFISLNNLIQTLLIIWVSFRTVRRIAWVFGLRPGLAGNWKLLRVLAENIAAQSFFDLATDEIANQIGGSLATRFMENSAEAFAAGALNVRLGKSLIRLLSEPLPGQRMDSE